jgi:hypothetical protein
MLLFAKGEVNSKSLLQKKCVFTVDEIAADLLSTTRQRKIT